MLLLMWGDSVRKMLLIVLIILTGCSSEQKEISRQEVIIREFIDVYYDFDLFNDYDCQIDDESSLESYMAFTKCTQDMFTDIYGDFISDDLLAEVYKLPGSRQITNMLLGHEYEVMEYELQIPDNFDFPNIFQLIVTDNIGGVTYDYAVNIEVVGDIITRFSAHNLG